MTDTLKGQNWLTMDDDSPADWEDWMAEAEAQRDRADTLAAELERERASRVIEYKPYRRQMTRAEWDALPQSAKVTNSDGSLMRVWMSGGRWPKLMHEGVEILPERAHND